MKMHPEGVGNQESVSLNAVRGAVQDFDKLLKDARSSGKDLTKIDGYQEALDAHNTIRDSQGDLKVAREEGKTLINWLKKLEK